MSLIDVLKSRKIIPVGIRHISKLGKGRYVIYLPSDLNYLWRELNESKVKVKVLIEVE